MRQISWLLAARLRILVIIGARGLELLQIYLSLRVGFAYFRVSARTSIGTIVLEYRCFYPTTNKFIPKGCTRVQVLQVADSAI